MPSRMPPSPLRKLSASRASNRADLEAGLAGGASGMESDIAHRANDVARSNALTGIDIARDRDDIMAGRHRDIALNSQATRMGNQANRFNRGFQTNEALSGRYRDIAGQRLRGRGEYRDWASGQQR